MKIFIPEPGEGWIGDNTTQEFKKQTSHEVVNSIEQADVVWLYSKWISNHFSQQILRMKPCITTVHHIVPEKGIDINYFDSFTDVYHVPNGITQRALSDRTRLPIKILPYWVPTQFGLTADPAVEPFERVEDSFIFGSFQRDTEGSTIMSAEPKPKLEKGPDILVSVVERFWNDRYLLVLAGWRRQYIKSRIPKSSLVDYTSNVNPDEKALKSYQEVNQLYNALRRAGGIYLVTSRHEGGPQAILEAAITGCKILSTNVGIASDVLHPLCICGEADDPETVNRFELKIRNKLPWNEILAYNMSQAKKLSLQNLIVSYDKLIEDSYASKQ